MPVLRFTLDFCKTTLLTLVRTSCIVSRKQTKRRRGSMSSYTDNTGTTTIKQAVEGFLLNCKVEGKSYVTIECYSDKLKDWMKNPS